MAGYTHIWEFIVAPDRQTAFESLYGPTGPWVALFRTAPGYLGTSLLRDRVSAERYLTVDRWTSESAWEAFRAERAAEYQALDAQGEGLTLAERDIGQFTELDVPAERDRSQDQPRQESHMLEQPAIVQTTAQPTAVIRLTIPRAEIQHVMGPGITELLATLATQGLAPAGPIFSHHFRMDPEVFDFELGVPVTAPVQPAGRVQPGQLPAATVARTVYRGPYEGLGPAWVEFEAWIAAEGHTSAPDLWECYAAGPESSPDPAAWRTELNRPLVRQRAP